MNQLESPVIRELINYAVINGFDVTAPDNASYIKVSNGVECVLFSETKEGDIIFHKIDRLNRQSYEIDCDEFRNLFLRRIKGKG